MIEVFKLVHSYYDSPAAVKINFNISNSILLEEMYKLQKFAFHYNLRKFAVCTTVYFTPWFALEL